MTSSHFGAADEPIGPLEHLRLLFLESGEHAAPRAVTWCDWVEVPVQLT